MEIRLTEIRFTEIRYTQLRYTQIRYTQQRYTQKRYNQNLYNKNIYKQKNNKHKIKPQQPVIAEIERRLGVNLLLEAAACDGIIIGEAGLLSREVNEFPIKVLEYWIKRIHPKLNIKSQNERFEFLLDELGIITRSKKKN